MKNYIFYTAEGYTKCPTIDGNEGEEADCENFQVLGHGEGHDAKEAWEKFKKDYPWVEEMGFGQEDVYAQQVVGQEVAVA